MNVVKEFILLAAGLILTVALAITGFQIFRNADRMGHALSESGQKRLEEFSEYELNKYEGLEVSGSRIITYVKQLNSEYDAEILLTVSNPASGEGFTYELSEAPGWQALRDTSSVYYINPLKKYTVTVVKDENAALESVVIRQTEE
ncbi:MAG: hypothetical protein IKS11_07155 [Lachnospiraceae bacterium]|nr:hypothetical protein [Lachnospiraceae bacterium]